MPNTYRKLCCAVLQSLQVALRGNTENGGSMIFSFLVAGDTFNRCFSSNLHMTYLGPSHSRKGITFRCVHEFYLQSTTSGLFVTDSSLIICKMRSVQAKRNPISQFRRDTLQRSGCQRRDYLEKHQCTDWVAWLSITSWIHPDRTIHSALDCLICMSTPDMTPWIVIFTRSL